MATGIRVQIFARAPVPGAVKTRLIPRLGAAGAAALYLRMIEHSLHIARDAAVGAVELWCTPSAADAAFEDLTGVGVTRHEQGDGDLGLRMHRALSCARRDGCAAILIGSDCPALTADDLRAAAAALNEGLDAAFTPAEDGGYLLIAARRSDAALFDEVAWGSDSVMKQTRERMSRLGWRWRELPTRWDVDRPEDYDRLLRERLPGIAA